MEVLPYLEQTNLKNTNPKWVQANSDPGLINFYLTTKYNIATLNGPNLLYYSTYTLDEYQLESIRLLETGEDFIQHSYDKYEEMKIEYKDNKIIKHLSMTGKVEYKHLYNKTIDKFSGRIIGGNIDVLFSMIGAKYDYVESFCKRFEEGIIWYLDNFDLKLPVLTRTLWYMKESGWFTNTKGFLIGRTYYQEKFDDFEYVDMLHKIFDDLEVPVIYDVDIGHVMPQWTIVNGSYAEFEYKAGTGKLTQKLI